MTPAEHDHRSLAGMVDRLLEDMKKALMLPASSVLEVLPKAARDLARAQGKEVELLVRGGEIEIDRRILEQMRDPLIHLVRNCIDHGIETAEQRKLKHKLPRGTISIAVAQKTGVGSKYSSRTTAPASTSPKSRRRRESWGSLLARTETARSRGTLAAHFPVRRFHQSDHHGRFRAGVWPCHRSGEGRKLGGSSRSSPNWTQAPPSGRAAAHAGDVSRRLRSRARSALRAAATTHMECAVRLEQTTVKTVENRETIGGTAGYRAGGAG
jgi:hypothetical protein